MSQLTERVQSVCRTLVGDHLPYEADLLDPVWDAFWQSVDCSAIEELPESLEWRLDSEPIRNLGATGDGSGREIDTLYVVGVIVQAVAKLLGRTGELTTSDIEQVLSAEATRAEAPAHLRGIFERHAVGLLAEHLTAVDWQSKQAEAPADGGRVWAEWCDQPAQSLDEAKIECDQFDAAAVKKKFEDRMHMFVLYIDEAKSGILLPNSMKKRQKPDLVRWSKFDARHLSLLGLILESARDRQPVLRYDVIARRVLSANSPLVESLKTAIRRTKSQLDELLDGVFKDVVVASRGMDQYQIERLMPYCWLRGGDGSSRLIR